MRNFKPQQIQRREIVSDDPAVIRPYLSDVYGSKLDVRVLEPAGNNWPKLAHRRTQCDGFAVEDVQHDGNVETTGGPSDGVVVLWTVRGRAESHLGERAAVAHPGELVLGSTGTTPVRVRTFGTSLKTAVLERGLLNRVAADQGSELRGTVRFDGVAPTSPGAARAWMKVRAFVAETVLANEEIATPLVIATAGRLLAATTLAAFPTMSGPDVDLRRDGEHHPAVLRRAIEYIEAHAVLDIGVSDIAGAVYVTPRALQYMFRRYLDTTPMSYLRRVRLDQVHQELLRSSRTNTTVTATAARWGFAHTGRFAVLYRETYGQSPHVTLRE